MNLMLRVFERTKILNKTSLRIFEETQKLRYFLRILCEQNYL